MTGDEETLMNRRKTKKAKLAEYRMSKTFFFFFSKEAKVMLVYIVSGSKLQAVPELRPDHPSNTSQKPQTRPLYVH